MKLRVSGNVRGWLLYASAWVPIGAVYGRLIGDQAGMSGGKAVFAGLDYVLVPALLGVAVWWISGRLRWPTRNTAVFFVLQLLFAAAYSGIWLALVLVSIAFGTGLDRAIEIIGTFAGWQLLTGVWMYGITAGIAYAIRVTRSLREKEAARARAEAGRVSAELSALRGQLNPHFLFNTLHTLMALVRRDPQTAEAALEQFGEMLRYVLDVNRAAHEDVALADEVAFIRNFFALEQLRLSGRLRVVENFDPDTLDCVIPSLTLQPLVENAVKYAAASRVEGAEITVSSRLERSSLVLEVSDDGPGITDGADSGSGLGLRAVRQRIEARYPGNSTFEVHTSAGKGFSVRLSLPAVAAPRRVEARGALPGHSRPDSVIAGIPR